MSRLAWLQFYPRDWTADTGLRSVSIAARGLWIEVLCIMHQSPDRGYLLNTLGGKIDAPQLARAVGEPVDTVAALLAELEAAGVFSRDDRGVIVSRRMVRDESFRAKCREVGKLGGNPSLIRKGKGQGNRGVNPPVNLDPTTGIKPHSSEFREQRRGGIRGIS